MPYVVDCNNAHTLAEVRRDEKRWAALDLLFFEDPLWPPEALLDCAAMPGITVGMGADLGSAEQMALYTKAPSIGVLQPDVCMLGGLSEAKRALATIEGAGKTAAPHTPFVGPAALASLHMLAIADGDGYFATVEADDSMDPYGIGLTRWKAALDVPDGSPGWASIPTRASCIATIMPRNEASYASPPPGERRKKRGKCSEETGWVRRYST
jgi:L-alanine-DL-glutamate epimerase-like enolase superfamily enzyme